MGFDFYLAMGCLCGGILLGISLARHNLNDEASRQFRLEKRRKQRASRKRLFTKVKRKKR